MLTFQNFCQAGFPLEVVEMPVGFLVETDDKNPVWMLTGCTGERYTIHYNTHYN